MQQIKKYILPFFIFVLLTGSIFLNVIEINNPKAPFLKDNDAPPVEKSLTKAGSLNEKLSLSLNDTAIEMKITNAETATITIKDDNKENMSKHVYFQVFATVKNVGSKAFSFSSTPVLGVSKDNFLLLAKNTVNNVEETKSEINTVGIVPNQNSNLMRPSFEIKPGAESSGFFLFENEVQTIQLISNGTPYIWQTMKPGASLLGKELSPSMAVINPEQTVEINLEDKKSAVFNDKNVSLLKFRVNNKSGNEISPLSFIPKYGTTIPGEVYKSEFINEDTASTLNAHMVTGETKLSPHRVEYYVVAFPKNVAFIFLQPPMIDNYTNIRILL